MQDLRVLLPFFVRWCLLLFHMSWSGFWFVFHSMHIGSPGAGGTQASTRQGWLQPACLLRSTSWLPSCLPFPRLSPSFFIYIWSRPICLFTNHVTYHKTSLPLVHTTYLLATSLPCYLGYDRQEPPNSFSIYPAVWLTGWLAVRLYPSSHS